MVGYIYLYYIDMNTVEGGELLLGLQSNDTFHALHLVAHCRVWIKHWSPIYIVKHNDLFKGYELNSRNINHEENIQQECIFSITGMYKTSRKLWVGSVPRGQFTVSTCTLYNGKLCWGFWVWDIMYLPLCHKYQSMPKELSVYLERTGHELCEIEIYMIAFIWHMEQISLHLAKFFRYGLHFNHNHVWFQVIHVH